MAFSTLVFPFVFLPVSLILYFVLPKQLKNAALVVCSLVFFAWGTPEYLVLMVLDIAFHYFAGRELALQKARGRSGRFVLVSSVLVNLLLLGFFKYYGFLVDNLNALLGTALRARELPMPIGVSFFTFSLLSYLFDVYRDRAPAARNMLDFSLYVTFFPKLVSGPIVQYAEMEPQLRDHPVTREGFGSGARLFLIGLAKKVLLANTLGTTFYALSALPMTQLSTLSAWLGAVCYALMLYFDFSGSNAIPAIRIWPSALPRCSASASARILTIPMSRRASRNSGGAGISRSARGSATTSTFPAAAAAQERRAPLRTCCSSGC